jgi:hypothetical protein
MCLGEVQAFKIELHTNDIGFPFIHLIDLDLFQEFLFRKTGPNIHKVYNYTAAQKFHS